MARLLGIDSDPVAAQRAAPHFDELATVDVEADPLPFDLPDGIDCVIYRSVLARLTDPWALVRRHARVLSPDGVMLICLPNHGHWRVASRLLAGSVDSGAPAGGWFGQESTLRQIARAGLVPCDVASRDDDTDAAARFAGTIAPALAALGVNAADYAKRAGASHLIWRVRKEPRERVILSGNMLEPIGGVSHVRVVHPLQAIATDPAFRAEVTDNIGTRAPADGIPRIFVLHRPALTGQAGPRLLRSLADAGYLIVTEFDDHPEHFPMMRMGGEIAFRGVHALQTSTAALAEVMRKYNPEIAVFPNTIVSLPEVRNFRDPSSMSFFFGALNREHDWRPLVPVINAVAAMAGERLKFQVVHDQDFFNALETPHKAFTPTCDYDTYTRILGGCEISFMPLADTPFNRSKSDLKFIEAGSCRVAALASTVVYGDSIDHGRTGLLFRDPEEFHNRLLRLLALPDLARTMADAARQYVTDHRMLAYQVAQRIAWYRSLWARRAFLNEALRQRMAALYQQAA